jgi:hypothetical protein
VPDGCDLAQEQGSGEDYSHIDEDVETKWSLVGRKDFSVDCDVA